VITLGRACLLLAFAVALYGIGAALYGARARRPEWVDSARRAVYALAGLLTLAFAVLEAAFLRSDFRLDVVATHSSTTTPTFYQLTAAWSSQEGSLLLWVWLLSLWSSVALWLTRRRLRAEAPYATAVLCGLAAFFAGLTVFLANPFALSPQPVLEGSGLNPLLRHPAMMIHPPMLYSGYTLFAIPFAFAIGALVTRRLGAQWITATRRFSLAAWTLLGLGILLGARWSYTELGWGGYWAWDPVENASLMPWLTATAFLHSAMIQEKRGMLKVWNVSLVLATGILCVLGTFLVRSGILDSIHAFGASTLGVPFLLLIAALVGLAVALVTSRRAALRSEHRLDSLLSREAVFAANNLVLVGLCFVIFWGTFFPLISEAVTGEKQSVGPPWFDRYTVPLALVLVLLSGIGPLIAWRRATVRTLRRAFAAPVAVAAATVVALVALTGAAARPLALAMFGLGAFVVAGVAQELWRGARARQAMTGGSLPAAALALVRRNRRRYGGYLVHAGIAVLFVGVAASAAFGTTRDLRLAPGQTARVGPYEIRYVRPTTDAAVSGGGIERIAFGADLAVRRDGRPLGVLHTERSYFPTQDPTLGPVGRYFEGEATSEVALRAGWRRDLWVVVQPDLQPLQPTIDQLDRALPAAVRRFGPASGPEVLARSLGAVAARYRARPAPMPFRVVASPMVTWIWVGGLIVLAGALVALWPPRPVARRAAVGARAGAARDGAPAAGPAPPERVPA
jgi:cytochrome c-type biogenesis protein CcmF